MTTQPELCPCGNPLHYANHTSAAIMHDIIAEMGPHILVSARGRSFMVPRHWIALHGLRSGELATLAKKYGWKEVSKT